MTTVNENLHSDKFEFVSLDSTSSEHIAAPHYSYWKSVFRKFFSSKVAILMLIIAVFVVVISLVQPLFSDYVAGEFKNINNLEMNYLKPSWEHWFGTDGYSNEMWDVVWLGARNSLGIAFIATLITTVLGVIVGAFWGYSKKFDRYMIEIYNVIANIPFTLLVFVLMYALGRGFWQMIFALSCTSWLGTAYFIRVQVMIIRDREYNLASRCLGTSSKNIIKNNILPYMISVVVTSVSRDVPNFISYEVFLSYLGIGLGEKVASLGRTISANTVFMNNTPHVFWIPVAVLAVITISLYVVGQTLADASDPKTHM